MSLRAAERIVQTLLYEGYLLYPYRRSSQKNRKRWSFGSLHPADRPGERSRIHAECLVRGDASARIDVHARFLQAVECRSVEGAHYEAIERTVTLEGCRLDEFIEKYFLLEPDSDAMRRTLRLSGTLGMAARTVSQNLFRIEIEVENGTAALDPELDVFASTHLVIHTENAEFVSLLEPPHELAELTAGLRNDGVFPILVGEPGVRDTLLASPIILYDYPAIAPESPGDLFDATEIDEILTLRILTLTEAEKAEIRATDPRGARLLERTEALGAAELSRLHGALRAAELAPGTRVRLRPRARADAFDIALAGRTATIHSIERTLESDVFFAVTIDDDPGADLGEQGMIGHRFFFRADEVEPLA